MTGLGGVVYRHGIVAAVPDVDGGPVGACDVLGDLADTGFAGVAHFRRQRAHGAGEYGLFGDDVVREAGIELGDGDDDGGKRIDGARGDRLQRVDDLGADGDRVDRLVRLSGVAAAALDGDVELIG